MSHQVTGKVLYTLLGAAALLALNGAAGATEMKMDTKPSMEKCYGVAKAGKNDCAAGTHSCAGQATKDADKASFVALPAGLCGKLHGGSLTSGA